MVDDGGSAQSDDEDWTDYSSASYGEAYDPWADMVSHKPAAQEDDFYDDEVWESRPPPADEGIDHLVNSGTCDWCIARLSGHRLDWQTAEQDGATLRTASAVRTGGASEEINEYCPYCENLFADLQIFCNRIVNSLAGVEFNRLQIGAQFPKDHVMAEEELRTRRGAQGSRGLKAAFNDALGTMLGDHFPDAQIVKERPEVMILIDTLTMKIKSEIRPLYLYGRYRKLERGIPQTRWPCRACKGREGGCESCDGTGQQYPASIQDLIGEPLREKLNARNTAFHGMGREDIDVVCLGRGRPFVLELKSPLIRTADLDELSDLINESADGRVEITGLRASRRSEVSRVKETAAEKSYRLSFDVEGEVSPEQVHEVLQGMAGVTLAQQTPQRVAHRRADKVRKRDVVSVDDIEVDLPNVQMSVRVQSGTYVKELVHGDEGRTTPSVAGLLEVACEVVSLDVLDIHAD